MKEVIKGVFAAVGAMIMIVMIVGIGWNFHWWLAKSTANHEAHINRTGYSNQQTLRDQITAKLGDVSDLDTQIGHEPSDAAQLRAQRKAIANIVCQDAEQVTGDALPEDQATWVDDNCVMGSAK